ncbi:hypothetical protein MLD38_007720 [Melastoma candidum]|uniref:Uncharacterized protein n=1 Tax=Melastoma candidum TaxID=119954 RepID=A0ACB9RVR5_9MYRT|nr:hypothetical protein MLD38_007720 [Melastoma candidum]
MGGRCKEGTTTPATATAAPRTSTSSNQRKGIAAEGRTPSGTEIEEFFATLERGRAQLLKNKYNYDFERDLPMEGRYEWVEIEADVGGN